MAYIAMQPAFGDQSAWRFFHAWLCLRRRYAGCMEAWYEGFSKTNAYQTKLSLT